MKVMLVDDEPSFHVLVQSVCESAGHEFRGVGDSRRLKSSRPMRPMSCCSTS